MNLLLVEDNESIILGLEYLLKEEGYIYAVARTFEEATIFFGQQNFDLVLLDITLPDGNGFELCKQFKKIQDIPIIFLTDRKSVV